MAEMDTKRLDVGKLEAADVLTTLNWAPENTTEISEAEADNASVTCCKQECQTYRAPTCCWPKVFHRQSIAPLAWEPGELDVGKLSAPDGQRAQARASAGHASRVGCLWALAAPANRPTWATLAARSHLSGDLEQCSMSKRMLLSCTSCCCTKQLWDCEWVRRLRSWPNLNRHMSWQHHAKDRWAIAFGWINLWFWVGCLHAVSKIYRLGPKLSRWI